MKIDQELLDEIAQLEVEALLEGLKDPELRKSPAFLEKVRKFLSNNKLITDPTTPGTPKLIRDIKSIPNFDEVN